MISVAKNIALALFLCDCIFFFIRREAGLSHASTFIPADPTHRSLLPDAGTCLIKLLIFFLHSL